MCNVISLLFKFSQFFFLKNSLRYSQTLAGICINAGRQFAAGVLDTSGKFIVINLKLHYQYLPGPVNDTGCQLSHTAL
jgi:hypothetical protein